jgi:transcriptional regulator with XRE-family HTH domain
MIDNRKIIGLALKDARAKKKLNQAAVADAIGTNRKAISKIESGTYIGAFSLFERYLDYLGFELTIKPKAHILPTLDNVHDMFKDEDE